MKTPLLAALSLAMGSALQAQEPEPTWELGKNVIDPVTIRGTVELVAGVVKLDGTNAFTLPAAALGAQNDYTIEFEVRRGAHAKGSLCLAGNSDDANKTGLGIKYFPPDYNALWLLTNGYRTVEYRGFLTDKFDKVTVVARDRKLTVFRNGLILAITDAVKPSALPLSFGEVLKEAVTPYELRNIKVYDTALFPTGSEQQAGGMMRYCSGEGYAIQRVEIKDPKLPRILVVGDSISMGYRGFITEHFKGKAYVDYWVGGSWFAHDVKGDDFPALRAWNGVLANGPYDVVSWNAMTLHMWNGSPGRVDEAKYPAQLAQVIEHLRKTAPNTKFIWIRCTPVRTTPDSGRPGFDPVRNGMVVRLNKVTDEVMARFGIPEIDLYALCEKRMDTVPAGSKDAVHWNTDVSREMAELIIAEIEKNLQAKP